MSEELSRFDAWIDEGGPSALVLKEYLQPAAGPGDVIFPPTFAGVGYVVDGEGEKSVCLIDSVGSQANRLEPVFKNPKYRGLVPQIEIRVKSRVVNLLDLGHRAADALARSTSLAAELQAAFTECADGSAARLAKIAPTTLVFGAWDSRGSQAKVPRLIASTIRASNVAELRRGAQYFSALEKDEIEELMGVDTQKQKDPLSEAGFLPAPSLTHGGVVVRGDIVRTTVLNLTALRALGGTVDLRRYILGLTLIAALAPADLFLRQGCLLVRDASRPVESKLVYRDGRQEDFADAAGAAEAFAEAAAQKFGVGESRVVDFDPKLAKAVLEGRAEKKAKKGK
jgi:CRISPR-associated protein Csb1